MSIKKTIVMVDINGIIPETTYIINESLIIYYNSDNVKYDIENNILEGSTEIKIRQNEINNNNNNNNDNELISEKPSLKRNFVEVNYPVIENKKDFDPVYFGYDEKVTFGKSSKLNNVADISNNFSSYRSPIQSKALDNNLVQNNIYENNIINPYNIKYFTPTYPINHTYYAPTYPFDVTDKILNEKQYNFLYKTPERDMKVDNNLGKIQKIGKIENMNFTDSDAQNLNKKFRENEMEKSKVKKLDKTVSDILAQRESRNQHLENDLRNQLILKIKRK